MKKKLMNKHVNQTLQHIYGYIKLYQVQHTPLHPTQKNQFHYINYAYAIFIYVCTFSYKQK